eukprot:symbB.v1.2.026991.t1/scaffold2739.1/size71924/6
MGAAEGAMREHDPLLPEQTRSQATRPRDARSKSRNEISPGTLLGVQYLPKGARGQISLPAGPAGNTKCPTADSDLSTTDATGRSQDTSPTIFGPETMKLQRGL